MAKSSINIQKTTIFALLHNLRAAIVTYVISTSDRNDSNRSMEEAYAYYLSLLKEAIFNYTSRTKQKIQTNEEKFLWEAVINLNENHKLDDLKELTEVLEEKYGWRSIHNSIHRDEGHIDLESGEKIYNYHGHVLLFMLDERGIYRFKKRDFGKNKMAELQTLTAEVLKMERGISKKKTKRERLDHRQYRQVAQEKAQMQKEINELKSEIYEQKMKNFNLISDLVDYENKDVEYELHLESIEKLLEQNIAESIENKNEDENFMHMLSDEIWELKEQIDVDIFKISELEEWKESIHQSILTLKENGQLATYDILLNQYFPDINEPETESGYKTDLIRLGSISESYDEDDEYEWKQDQKI
ncbi:MAG: hypothetical protein GQ531_01285 [Sulfurovum sp.]|nr:hypothetical protein [Sulfurovum sp.]